MSTTRNERRKQIRVLGLNPVTRGSAKLDIHAEGCRDKQCASHCACWCHEPKPNKDKR